MVALQLTEREYADFKRFRNTLRKGKRVVAIELTEEEYHLFNWCRLRHKPAKLWAFARDAMLDAARETVRAEIARGKRVPAEIVQSLESGQVGK